MRREVRHIVAAARRRQLLAMAGWSLPEALPTAVSGVVVARALDDGFLAERPLVGLAWLAGYLVTAGIGAIGSRQLYLRLGNLVEPFRDDLVRRVVGGALRHAVVGRADDGAVSRLTRQVESVRDAYAGILVIVLGFAATVVGVVAGLLALDPALAALVVPPFLLGIGLYLAMLGLAAARERDAVHADEHLAKAAGAVIAGRRDVVACGGEERAAAMVAEPIEQQAAAERSLARVAALRAVCFAVGGWVPLLVILLSGSRLVAEGLTAGAIMGALTYVLFGLQPALRTLISGLGSSGLRLVVTLSRILDAATPPKLPDRPERLAVVATGYEMRLRDVTFAYGPHAEPVLRSLDLTVPEGDHLAVVGPSGIGKSTLAALLCGLLRPGAGAVELGGAPAAELPVDRLAATRVLIPQEAYVFSGSVWDNLAYLHPAVTPDRVAAAAQQVGADELLSRLAGEAFGSRPDAAHSAQIVPSELSAGERQLIALVRAYVSPAPVVVLDEATCHLDPVAERRAEEAFATRPGTLVVIAHRISSAVRASRVLVLDGSSAVVGEHDSLLAASPLYRDLLGHWTVPSPALSMSSDQTRPSRVP